MQKKKKKSMRIWITGILLLLMVSAGIYAVSILFKPLSLPETVYIYIDGQKNQEDVVTQLREKASLPSEKIFRLLAERMNYPNKVKSGRYAIRDGMTMPEVIRLLRSGNQTPVDLTFNNMRTVENLAGRMSQQLMMDSLTLLNVLENSANAQKYGFNDETFISMFIPNTYEVYWDTSIENLLNRMKREYDAFWNESRRGKAKNLGLTPVEVSILASIVEEEATYADEYPAVAGLYLNRLTKGMRLEADPTVIYPITRGKPLGRRILQSELMADNGYNTYVRAGLPEGPITNPGRDSIAAVLQPERNDYLFMVADGSGRHLFAATFAEHQHNVRRWYAIRRQRGEM
jgi:UPF0755 protein